MKSTLFSLFLSLLSFSLYAQSTPDTSSGKTLVIQETPGKLLHPPKVFVESGNEEIAGSPEAGIKPAYRQWENRCKEWKSELRHLNGGNLMMVSCGSPKKTSERVQSENYYTYTSTGTYKIKVVGK